MEENTFDKGMLTLMVYYQNFEFDTAPKEKDLVGKFKKKVWYEALSKITDDTFMKLVESYCKSNIYPPQSPTHLIQHMKDLVLLNEMSGEEAWEYAYKIVKKNIFEVSWAMSELKKEGKDNIANTLKEMESRFRNLLTDDLPYVRKDFIEIYKRIVTQNVNQNVLLGDLSQLKLGEGK